MIKMRCVDGALDRVFVNQDGKTHQPIDGVIEVGLGDVEAAKKLGWVVVE